ncbi:hypothetical protein [Aquicella lusitana]|uniref:Uncharacterized protein n=1 Tax=Aquicella lusitana TaxID=254246 RepID=A0A370GFW2_9COXI|nr:hypothetical protein [Aquicella lusitana]RDI42096.1 hypothetical protein C8D86_11650 [Aquicella lusitana]VVC74397.1 hypothetical protein AQULUS_21630 [Aquicella lusitana]
MEKVLISIPDQLAARMRATIPARQRSKIITLLIEEEIEKRERALYECALAVEQDNELRREMEEWNVTLNDGLTEEGKSALTGKIKSK